MKPTFFRALPLHGALPLLALVAACGRAPAAPAPAPLPAPAASAPASTTPVTATPTPVAAAPTPDAAATGGTRAAGKDSLHRDDVTRQAVRVFGDSVARVDAGEGEDEEGGPTYDIDVRSYETHERVAHYVRMFGGSARGRIADRLEHGTRYEDMIRAKFRAGGIPEDMAYLALIESGYDNHAYSRAAAVGMWQFMSSTAKGLGMRVDWWIDERRDPVASTDGAVKFLGWLREQLGSYYLAAAAYNGGPGRVSRGLTRFASDLEGQSGDDQFFTLFEKDFLPKETKNYVPQLIAAAIVAKDPVRYGLEITPRAPFVYDSVRVPAATPVALVARLTGSTVTEVTELNPHVLRGVTPPTGSGMWIRVPVGKGEGFATALEAAPDADRKAFTRVTTKKGQTVATLAREHGLTVRQLEWYNRGLKKSKKGTLSVGQVVLVPSALVVAAARDVPDPAVEIYGSSSRGKVKYHVVKRGESLGLIARKNRITVARLKALNGLRKDMVFPGQQLAVSGNPAKAKSTKSRPTRLAKGTSRSSGKVALSTKARVKGGKAKATPAKSSAKKAPARKSSAKKAPVKKAATKKAG